MNAVPFVVRAGALAALLALGCAKPDDAAKAKAEVDAVNAELKKTTEEIKVMRDELARLRVERGLPPGPAAKAEPEQPIEERLSKLHANYSANAITLTEWTALKAKVIAQIPATVPASETRSYGQRFIDLKRVYDANGVTLTEWTDAKQKLIAQVPSPARAAPVLDGELTELKRAYDANALTLTEWTTAKAEMVKWAK